MVKAFASLTQASGSARLFAQGFAIFFEQTPLRTSRRLPQRYRAEQSSAYLAG
jgi:hypothetical protein